MKLLLIVSFCTMAQCVPKLSSFLKGGPSMIPESNQLTEFKCNIFYSATFHMCLTKIIYFQSEFTVDTKPVYFTMDWRTRRDLPTDDISFVSEIVKTINIMFNNNMEMESVWLIYICMYKLNQFLKDVARKNSYDNIKSRTENLAMYELVESTLATDIRKTACNQHDYFNMQSENCEHFKKFKDIIREAGNNGNPAIIETVKSNKFLINGKIDNMKGLAEEGSVKWGLDTFTGIEVLYFKNRYGHRSFFNNYSDYVATTSWSRIVKTIEDIRDGTFVDGLKGIKYLGLYQMTVVRALKTIFLGLTWSYVRDLPKCCANEFIEVVQRFVQLTALDGDNDFGLLLKVMRKGCNKGIIRQIESTLNVNPMFYYLVVTEPKTTKSHTELLGVIQSFLDKLDETFGSPTVFIHCSTFSRMAHNRIVSEIDYVHTMRGYK
ncbi:uncharacterized protein LOC126836599 [Adelges cooleyi]|uniref:uncharacterized protein LOC126836599 n=1 Tax=Adelges cooleyi TaxID=133065 RepID=UPI00217F9E1F|nr:uncharacterized protein LOC126836599 [Adelges cooleyi]